MRATIPLTVLALATPILHAEITPFAAFLDGNQFPPSGSPATGSAGGTYDSGLNRFSFAWAISDTLIGMPGSPGAHIHRGFPGETGPILKDFTSPDGTWPLEGAANWNNLTAFERGLLFGGGLYINFHTTAFPSGEVRGQIVLVPAPAAFPLLAAAWSARGRRRR